MPKESNNAISGCYTDVLSHMDFFPFQVEQWYQKQRVKPKPETFSEREDSDIITAYWSENMRTEAFPEKSDRKQK